MNIIFIKNGLIVNRLKRFEIKESETIFFYLTIMNKKWLIVFRYRRRRDNLKMLFEELSDSSNRTIK